MLHKNHKLNLINRDRPKINKAIFSYIAFHKKYMYKLNTSCFLTSTFPIFIIQGIFLKDVIEKMLKFHIFKYMLKQT